MYPCQSPSFGIWMPYLDVSRLVISHDMGYYITLYCDMSCGITPDHQNSPGKNNFNENRPHCCGLRFALAPSLCSLLALSPAWPFLSSFCCPSDGHTIGLTVPPSNTNLFPWRYGLLPECMIVFVLFFVLFRSLPIFPSCYISHGIGSEIYQKCSRYWNRYVPKIRKYRMIYREI